MRKGIDDTVLLTEVEETLKEIERQKAILRYRKEKNIELKAVNREELIEALKSLQVEEQAVIILFENHLLEISRWLWEEINSPRRTSAVMGHRMDHFLNHIYISRKLGITSICFIQEGFVSPSVGVDMYVNYETKEGIEGYLDGGKLCFKDPEVDQLWPKGVRFLLQASILAHYHDIVISREKVVEEITQEITEGREELKEEISLERKKREMKFRRAHLRDLKDKLASPKQIALAIESGKYSEQEVQRIIENGHITFVREFVADEQLPAVEPRRLFQRIDAVRFLNLYLASARK